MTTQQPLFRDGAGWSGSEPTPIEEFGWGDGTIAIALGCASVGACMIAALLIAIGMSLGRLS